MPFDYTGDLRPLDAPNQAGILCGRDPSYAFYPRWSDGVDQTVTCVDCLAYIEQLIVKVHDYDPENENYAPWLAKVTSFDRPYVYFQPWTPWNEDPEMQYDGVPFRKLMHEIDALYAPSGWDAENWRLL